jgi:hypothetical protein
MRAEMSLLSAIIIGALGSAVFAGLSWSVKWLRVEDNRVSLRQALCWHRWQPIEDLSGDGIIFVTPYDESCPKCGKRRVSPDER